MNECKLQTFFVSARLNTLLIFRFKFLFNTFVHVQTKFLHLLVAAYSQRIIINLKVSFVLRSIEVPFGSTAIQWNEHLAVLNERIHDRKAKVIHRVASSECCRYLRYQCSNT